MVDVVSPARSGRNGIGGVEDGRERFDHLLQYTCRGKVGIVVVDIRQLWRCQRDRHQRDLWSCVSMGHESRVNSTD